MKVKVETFIKSVALHDKSLRGLLTAFIAQEEAVAKKPLSPEEKENIMKEVSHNLSEATYLTNYVEEFSKVFSEEDLSYLIKVYESEPMKKYKDQGEKLFTPFYNDMREMVKDKVINIS